MENTQKNGSKPVFIIYKCRWKFTWILILLLLISILIFLEFHGGKPELYRLF